jgi:hypothetical protein
MVHRLPRRRPPPRPGGASCLARVDIAISISMTCSSRPHDPAALAASSWRLRDPFQAGALGLHVVREDHARPTRGRRQRRWTFTIRP